MADRQHTIVCIFDPNSPRISAYEIHEWIYEQLQVTEHALAMIQIDGTRRQVFLKFVNDTYIKDTLQSTNGRAEYRHVMEEISIVRVEMAGMGTHRVRIANLPPEVLERMVRLALATYGDILAIHDEMWSKAYQYTVVNGVKVITMKLTKHILSNMSIAANRVLASYDSQPVTCYGWGETGHMYQACPKQCKQGTDTAEPPSNTWTQVAAQGRLTRWGTGKDRMDLSPHQALCDQSLDSPALDNNLAVVATPQMPEEEQSNIKMVTLLNLGSNVSLTNTSVATVILPLPIPQNVSANCLSWCDHHSKWFRCVVLLWCICGRILLACAHVSGTFLVQIFVCD
jgi:hypothetical protein